MRWRLVEGPDQRRNQEDKGEIRWTTKRQRGVAVGHGEAPTAVVGQSW